jgi:hypothetical protein
VLVDHARSIYRDTLTNGGGTYPAAPRGFVVGLCVGSFAKVSVGDELGFVDAVYRLHDAYPNTGFGTWLDGDVIHIDPVIVLPDEPAAKLLANHYAQKAYYNLSAKEVVPCQASAA